MLINLGITTVLSIVIGVAAWLTLTYAVYRINAWTTKNKSDKE